MTRAPIRQSSPTANWRAILFGLLLLLFEVYWVTVAEMKYGSQATALPLFIYPVFILFYLVVINNGLSLFLRLRLFTAADLLTIYVMLVIGTSFSAYGMLQIYLPLWFILPVLLRLKTIGEIYFFTIFHGTLPSILSTSWPDITKATQPCTERITFESGYCRPLPGSVLCQSADARLRRQWIPDERLAFPVIQLPLNMVQSDSFFRPRMLWIGFAVVAAFDILSGLKTLFPSVPHLHLKLFDIKQYFTEKPWNTIGTTRISFYPFMIGIGFFLPLDLSSSCWFFFIFGSHFGCPHENSRWIFNRWPEILACFWGN